MTENDPKIKSHIRQILYGVAVGDALGYPYQFETRLVRKAKSVVDMGVCENNIGVKYLLKEQEVGLWSDDTALTLCLADSLATGYDLKDIAEKLCSWHYEGSYSARGFAEDEGGQTRSAMLLLMEILDSGEYGKLAHLIDDSSESANGNGALMRILPLIVLTYHRDIQDQLRLVTEVSALTHPHIRSVLCCLWYLKYAEAIIDGIDKNTAVTVTQQDIRELLGDIICSELDRQELNRLLTEDLSWGITAPEREGMSGYIYSGGYVVHTLEAAMFCLMNCSSYADTVLMAVNLGDDTDTVAAVAGGLAGILYGVEGIPPTWIEALKKPDLFRDIVAAYEAT